MVEVFPVL